MIAQSENYPFYIPLLTVLQTLAIYTLGALLLSSYGLIVVLLYLAFCLLAEYRVLEMSCRYCYYYGKLCGVGKGLIAPLFFKKGDPAMPCSGFMRACLICSSCKQRELGCPAEKLFNKTSAN